jgi:hypothetical protein
MPETPLERATVECRTLEGRLLATVDILPAGRVNVLNSVDHPLVLLPTEEARMYAEEPVQLCERGRYEYRLKPSVTAPPNLALLPQRGIYPSRVETDGHDRGLIEPGDHCGLLPLVVIQWNDAEQRPLA